MKSTFVSILTVFCFISFNSSNLLATSLGIVKGKRIVALNKSVGSSIVKYVSTSPVEKFEGNSQEIRGQFILDADNIELSTGQITLDVKTMKSGLTKRDDHMYGKDWLDASAFPTITFDLKKITGVSISKSDNSMTEFTGTAEGNFTLHGVSKYVKSWISIKYVKESEASKKRADGDFVLLKTTFKVSLKDFNIAGRGDIIGSKVGESIDIEATLFGATTN